MGRLVVPLAHQSQQLEHLDHEGARREVGVQLGAQGDDRCARQALGILGEGGSPLGLLREVELALVDLLGT